MSTSISEVRVGLATCGIAAGAERVYDALQKSLEQHQLDVCVKRVGCMGMCYNEPLVEILNDKGESTVYRQIKPEDVERIVCEHVIGGACVDELAVSDDEFLRRGKPAGSIPP